MIMKNSKIYFYTTIGTTVTILLFIILANFIVDPLQHYRMASFYKPYYKNSRYLNPGLAKTHDYNTVIVGTSMVQNFRPSYIDKLWNVKSIKLPWPGSSSYELGLTLETALRTGKVQRVLFGLDVFSFKGAAARLSNGPGSIPHYLYDDNIFNDLKYLLSIDTLTSLKYIIKANILGKNKRYLEHDNYGYWGHKFEFSKKAVINNWNRAGFNQEFSKEDFKASNLINNFEKNLYIYFKKYPSVQFDVFFPPYSILTWVDSEEKGINKDIFDFKRYVVNRSSNLGNVRIFEFQDIENIITDLDNYKDISHFSPKINDFIIESISEGNYLVEGSLYYKRQNNLSTFIDSFADYYPR